MKRVIAIAAAGMAMGALSASANYTDITINDTTGIIGNTGWYRVGPGVAENDEVEPNCNPGQLWDMEAFLWDATNKKMQIQGGFDMKNGYGGYYGGDLFIDVDGIVNWGINAPPGNSPANTYATHLNSAYKWDYVVVFGRVNSDVGGSAYTGGYQVYNIQGAASDVEVFYDQNNGSNPFRYQSGGSPVPGASGTVTQATSLDSAGSYLLGEIDLSFLAGLGGTPGLTFHWTQGCGNDNLMGKTTSFSVPDGGLTVGLMGLSLSALGFASRRLRKN